MVTETIYVQIIQTVRAQLGEPDDNQRPKIVTNIQALTTIADQTVRAQTVRAQSGDRMTIIDQRLSQNKL